MREVAILIVNVGLITPTASLRSAFSPHRGSIITVEHRPESATSGWRTDVGGFWGSRFTMHDTNLGHSPQPDLRASPATGSRVLLSRGVRVMQPVGAGTSFEG